MNLQDQQGINEHCSIADCWWFFAMPTMSISWIAFSPLRGFKPASGIPPCFSTINQQGISMEPTATVPKYSWSSFHPKNPLLPRSEQELDVRVLPKRDIVHHGKCHGKWETRVLEKSAFSSLFSTPRTCWLPKKDCDWSNSGYS